MIRPILPFNHDPEGILRQKASPVEISPALEDLIQDLFDSMYAAYGIGLAAPQVGVSQRVFVTDVSFKEDPGARCVFINPTLIDSYGQQVDEEGCLSVPGVKKWIARPRFITVRAQYIGGVFDMGLEDLSARAFCHELDHLNGKLIIDHEEVTVPERRNL